MDSDRSLTAPSCAQSGTYAIGRCQRLDSGLVTQRLRVILWAELGGLDKPKISVSNGGGVIFFEAWLIVRASVQKHALHK
jgi:hypothetical protein